MKSSPDKHPSTYRNIPKALPAITSEIRELSISLLPESYKATRAYTKNSCSATAAEPLFFMEVEARG